MVPAAARLSAGSSPGRWLHVPLLTRFQQFDHDALLFLPLVPGGCQAPRKRGFIFVSI